MRRGLKGLGELQTSTDGSFSARHTACWVGLSLSGHLVIGSSGDLRTKRYVFSIAQSPDGQIARSLESVPASIKLVLCFLNSFISAASVFPRMACSWPSESWWGF